MAKKSDAENKPTKKEENPEHGLSGSEANERMSKYGHNELSEEKINPVMKKIESLIATFSNKEGWKRKRARLALVDIGKPAVPYLIKAMKHHKAEVRWEAVKTLGAIRDSRSGPDMVSALTDKNFEIRWLAAEGLIALKLGAIKPLLKALIKTPESWELRQGAHHVLHALERTHLLNKSCINLLNNLRGLDQEISVPLAANAALRSLFKPDK